MYGKFNLIIDLTLAGGEGASAQSTDRSNPTLITSNELTIAGPQKSNQQLTNQLEEGI
jgi:hypothetical protein